MNITRDISWCVSRFTARRRMVVSVIIVKRLITRVNVSYQARSYMYRVAAEDPRGRRAVAELLAVSLQN